MYRRGSAETKREGELSWYSYLFTQTHTDTHTHTLSLLPSVCLCLSIYISISFLYWIPLKLFCLFFNTWWWRVTFSRCWLRRVRAAMRILPRDCESRGRITARDRGGFVEGGGGRAGWTNMGRGREIIVNIMKLRWWNCRIRGGRGGGG